MGKSHQLRLLNSTMKPIHLLLFIVSSSQSWHIHYKNNCEDNISAIQFAISDPVSAISLHLDPDETMESQPFDNETVTVLGDAGLTAHFRREKLFVTRYHLDNLNAYTESEMTVEIRPRGPALPTLHCNSTVCRKIGLFDAEAPASESRQSASALSTTDFDVIFCAPAPPAVKNEEKKTKIAFML